PESWCYLDAGELVAGAGELAPDDEELAPEEGVADLPATSRLPSTSISTRRSGCRQSTSFLLLLRSGPMFAHWLPVTGSDSPRPCAWICCACRRAVSARYCRTASARRCESCSLYFSEPMRSAWPTISTRSTRASLMLFASSSSFWRPSGRSSALSNSNSTSLDRLTFSITVDGAGAAAGGGGGGASRAASGAAGAAARGTASHAAAALSVVQSPVRQQLPLESVIAPSPVLVT